jgi:hypothetical protein
MSFFVEQKEASVIGIARAFSPTTPQKQSQFNIVVVQQ